MTLASSQRIWYSAMRPGDVIHDTADGETCIVLWNIRLGERSRVGFLSSWGDVWEFDPMADDTARGDWKLWNLVARAGGER